MSQNIFPLMESFYTIQGEGFYEGNAAYFIRLAGCDVGCVWCDVKDSWDAKKHPLKTIEQIKTKLLEEVGNQKPIVVITGGEPLLHNLDELTKVLISEGFRTHIETSGSSALSGKWNWICLSPKKFKPALDSVISEANELKVVVFHKSDLEWAIQYEAKIYENCIKYLQPEWEKREIVLPFIIEFVKNNPSWKISIQAHKYINVP
jgi:7-carboxy-7-deazaguanine synthase